MAIKIQRQTASASSAPPPSTLPYGELACDKTAVLYVGNSSNYPVKMMDTNSYNQVGNPNLLDNTNFKNLVNQRSKSSYSLDWKYSIDRWVLLGTYSVSNHTLTFDAGNQTSRFGLDAISYMRQGIEKLDAGTYTISAGIGDTVYSHSFVVGSTVASQAWNMGPFYFVYEKFSGVNTQWFGFGVVPGASSPGSVALDWIKLEAGDTATPYVPKGYGAELAECQRYFKRVGNRGFRGWATNETNVVCCLTLATQMRVKPTITPVGTLTAYDEVSGVTVTMDSSTGSTVDTARITAHGTGLTAFRTYSLLGNVDISADL